MFGLKEKLVKKLNRFIQDIRGQYSLTDWVMGVIILAILGVGVALPIVIDTVNRVLSNLTGTTALVVGAIPTIVAVVIVLMFMGRH